MNKIVFPMLVLSGALLLPFSCSKSEPAPTPAPAVVPPTPVAPPTTVVAAAQPILPEQADAVAAALEKELDAELASDE